MVHIHAGKMLIHVSKSKTKQKQNRIVLVDVPSEERWRSQSLSPESTTILTYPSLPHAPQLCVILSTCTWSCDLRRRWKGSWRETTSVQLWGHFHPCWSETLQWCGCLGGHPHSCSVRITLKFTFFCLSLLSAGITGYRPNLPDLCRGGDQMQGLIERQATIPPTELPVHSWFIFAFWYQISLWPQSLCFSYLSDSFHACVFGQLCKWMQRQRR